MTGFNILSISICLFLMSPVCMAQPADTSYLNELKKELKKQWPENRTINLVFHGHSVPTGYFRTPDVKTLEAYPHQVLKLLKEKYPYAVINVITTSIGGENSAQGATRFKKEVLCHKPDVIFIDYALNDRRIGLGKANKAWEKMIKMALKRNIKVILLTPTPDTSAAMFDTHDPLNLHSAQIEKLSATYHTGLIDCYSAFKMLSKEGSKPDDYMSQVNHPNAKGHEIVAREIMKYF